MFLICENKRETEGDNIGDIIWKFPAGKCESKISDDCFVTWSVGLSCPGSTLLSLTNCRLISLQINFAVMAQAFHVMSEKRNKAPDDGTAADVW